MRRMKHVNRTKKHNDLKGRMRGAGRAAALLFALLLVLQASSLGASAVGTASAGGDYTPEELLGGIWRLEDGSYRNEQAAKPSVQFAMSSLPNLYKGQTLALAMEATLGDYDQEWIYVRAWNVTKDTWVWWTRDVKNLHGVDGEIRTGSAGDKVYRLLTADTLGEYAEYLGTGHYRVYACVYGRMDSYSDSGELLPADRADYVSEEFVVMDFDMTEDTRPAAMPMYRLYNAGNHEHFYTSDAHERQVLIESYGWDDENIGWYAPASSRTPVYRLYNPYSSDHHYTMDVDEVMQMLTDGWRFEGVGWYSDDACSVTLFRAFSPVLTTGTHHYTTDAHEIATICDGVNWRNEGTAWYGVFPPAE